MSTDTHIDIYTGRPGCGKTSKLVDEMLETAGRYLFAMPRTDLIKERVHDLKAKAAERSINPIILPIHSGQNFKAPVRRRLPEAAAQYGHEPHVIILITHEALMSADLAGFNGWHARIDEAPDGVASDKVRIPATSRLFEQVYDLEPIDGTKWSRLAVRPGAPSLRDFLKDDFGEELAAFHKRALSPSGVVVDIQDWAQATQGRAVKWWSAWTPSALSDFASIKIAASGYFTSLGYKLAVRMCPDLEFNETEIASERTGSPVVRIGYFTRGHRASTAFWKSKAGRECLKQVGRWLDQVDDLGYWSGNEMVRERLDVALSGAQVLPKQAGTNEYRHHRSCTFIYSNKAQDSDDAILEVFGLDKADIERARETEDIEQFVMRGAIRDPQFSGRYDIYLYDFEQAHRLHEFLNGHGLAQIELFAIEDAGIMDVKRPTGGRRAVDPDPEARKARRRLKDTENKRKRRAEEREAKRQAGTLRARGRPVRDSEGAVEVQGV